MFVGSLNFGFCELNLAFADWGRKSRNEGTNVLLPDQIFRYAYNGIISAYRLFSCTLFHSKNNKVHFSRTSTHQKSVTVSSCSEFSALVSYSESNSLSKKIFWTVAWWRYHGVMLEGRLLQTIAGLISKRVTRPRASSDYNRKSYTRLLSPWERAPIDWL